MGTWPCVHVPHHNLGSCCGCTWGLELSEQAVFKVFVHVMGAKARMNPKSGWKSSLSPCPPWAVVQLSVCGALHTVMVTLPGLWVWCNVSFTRIVHKKGTAPMGLSCHSSGDFGRAMALDAHRGSAPEHVSGCGHSSKIVCFLDRHLCNIT